MRIGVFHEAPYYLRYYATALTTIVERGHRLFLARPDRYDEVPVPEDIAEAVGGLDGALPMGSLGRP